jgi:hypothetical protein
VAVGESVSWDVPVGGAEGDPAAPDGDARNDGDGGGEGLPVTVVEGLEHTVGAPTVAVGATLRELPPPPPLVVGAAVLEGSGERVPGGSEGVTVGVLPPPPPPLSVAMGVALPGALLPVPVRVPTCEALPAPPALALPEGEGA